LAQRDLSESVLRILKNSILLSTGLPAIGTGGQTSRVNQRSRESMLRMAQSCERIAQRCQEEPPKRGAKQEIN